MFTRLMAGSFVLLLLITLHACNDSGSSGSGGGGGAVVNASPGGIWNGNDPYTGSALTGIVTESGEFTFIRSDGLQYFGTVTTSGNDIAGTYTAVVPAGSSFTDGSAYGTGTIAGTIQERTTISATVTFTTAKGTNASSKALSLTFNSLYDSGSSLSAIAGNYFDPTDNSIISISASGVIFSQDATTGCVINGQVSIIDASYDAYQFSYTFANCLGAAAYLNGTTATGLGALNTTVSPFTAYIGIHNSATPYVLTMSYQKQ